MSDLTATLRFAALKTVIQNIKTNDDATVKIRALIAEFITSTRQDKKGKNSLFLRRKVMKSRLNFELSYVYDYLRYLNGEESILVKNEIQEADAQEFHALISRTIKCNENSQYFKLGDEFKIIGCDGAYLYEMIKDAQAEALGLSIEHPGNQVGLIRMMPIQTFHDYLVEEKIYWL